VSGPVIGPDGRPRTPWAYGDPLLLRYYDEEWGRAVRDERGVFERLSLEAFQAGLSWLTVLRKREALRERFAGFDPERVAAFGEEDVERVLADPRVIRSRAKVLATVGNARATLALREEGGLHELVWSFRPERTPAPRETSEVPTTSPESHALAAELRRRGFRFVGPTTVFALMEAIGIVDTHLVGSWRRGVSGVWPAA